MNNLNRKIYQFYETKRGLYFISFILPMMIMLVVWLIMGVYPFGSKTLMSIDFGQQYIDLFQLFKQTLLSADWSNLFYSFSKSIGGTMISNWGYYLMSPFNLIYAILPTSEFRLAVTLIIWIRYGVISLSFSHLLIKRYNGHLNQRRFLVPLLATVYTLSGFLVSYQMNPIFYDAMIMLPLVILCLEEVLDGASGIKYAFILGLTLVLHYYMGYMICLFIVMYSLFYMSDKRLFSKKALIQLLKAAGYSMIGVGLAMWLLYPTLMDLLISKGAYGQSLTFEWGLQIRPLDILAKLMIGAFDSESWPAGPNLPNIFIGSFSLFGFGLFFAKKDIKTSQKIAAFFVVFVFFISIVNVFFNKIWHMGQTPAGFFYRFSWIISFFMVLLSYRAIHNWRGYSWRFIAVGVTFIYLAAEWVFTNDFSFFKYSVNNSVVLTLESYLGLVIRILIILFAASSVQYFNEKGKTKAVLMLIGSAIAFIILTLLNHYEKLVTLQTLTLITWIITLVVLSSGFKASIYRFIILMTIFELGLNAYISQSRMNYDNAYKFKDAQVSMLEVIDQIRPSKEGEFYRINKFFERSKNDPLMLNYPGMTHFSSNMERSTLSFMTNVGDSGSNASSFYGNGTVFMDAFYGIRYVVDYLPYTNEEVINHPERHFFGRNSTRKDLLDYYTPYWSNERFIVYENQNVLPIAFGVNTQTTDLTLESNQVVKTNNDILSAISGQDVKMFNSYLFESTELLNVQIDENTLGRKIYRKIDSESEGIITFKLIPQTNATYYVNAPLALKRQKGGATDIQLNGSWYEYQHSFDGQQLWNVAHNQQGEEIVLTLTMRSTNELDLTDLYVITADQTFSEQIIQERMAQGMQVEQWGNRFIKGTVNITDDSTFMMTSIPYNEGWQVKVDGQEVPIKLTWGAFMSFPITSGQHTIEMRFTPKGWYIGLMISVSSFVILVVFMLLEKRPRKLVRSK